MSLTMHAEPRHGYVLFTVGGKYDLSSAKRCTRSRCRWRTSDPTHWSIHSVSAKWSRNRGALVKMTTGMEEGLAWLGVDAA